MSVFNQLQTDPNNESSPLINVENTNVTDKENKKAIGSYGTIISTINSKYREVNNYDILIFTLILWNIYVCRKTIYPFSKEFAKFYELSINSFSFILSAYDVGGFTSIILAMFPSLHNIRIATLFFLLTFTLAILYLILSFCYIFIALFLVRMAMGFLATTIVAEVRGILSVFTKENKPNKSSQTSLTFRIMLTESSWFTSSVSWIIIGVILNRLNVTYVWYFGCICAVLTSFLCYFLPSFTVSYALSMKSTTKLTDNVILTHDHDQESLWRQYHLYFMYSASICWNGAYAAFLATFGPYMQVAFHLNAEQLGFQTMFISVAELVALLTTIYASKYKSNMWLTIFSASITVVTTLIFVIGLSLDVVNELFVWIILFVLTMFIEYAFLNMIVANLIMTPHGLESKSALMLQTVGRAASVIGAILGLHIETWNGFSTVMQCIFGTQILGFILYCAASKQYDRSNLV